MKKCVLGMVFLVLGALAFPASGGDLFNAVEDGDPEKVMRVLAGGVDNVNWKDKAGRTPLIQACLDGNLEVVGTLLRYGALVTEIDDSGWYPLLAACSSQNRDLVDLISSLEAARITLGVVGHEGMTPLSLAAQLKNKEIFQVLVKNGAPRGELLQSRAADELLVALDANAPEILDLIKAHGTNLQVVDGNGSSLLHLVCQGGVPALETVQWLLANKFDPNAVDASGKTPLFYATERDRVDVVKELLKAGANPKLTDKAKKRALDYTKNPELVKLLK